MQLNKLIKDLEIKQVIGNLDLEIREVKIDSNSITKGDMFICLIGANYDGHDFINQVENYGASVVVTEKILQTNITQIVVENSRLAMSKIASNYFNNPEKQIKIIGVVGTNGKTSTCHIIKNILEKAGVKCGVVGTLGVEYADKFFESKLTTPDPLDFFAIIKDMVDNGIQCVVMEVSAHSIYLDKVRNLQFDIAIFTNFTRDHLDFFENMEKYEQTKYSFFEKNICKYIVANIDDELGAKISKNLKGVITYGIDNPADVFAMDIKQTVKGNIFLINLFDCVYEIDLNLFGDFNVYNALASATATALFGVKPNVIASALCSVEKIDGRLEKVFEKDFSVYIDYAHTPDGLTKVLTTLKKNCKGKLICVFGCGGNRDFGKRELMGKISANIADFTVITSDNPRFEEPMDIMSEIEKGHLQVSKKYVMVQDRVEGIKYAIAMAKKDDVVLIAGKGGEKYQEVLGIKHLYNDKDTVN